MRPILTGIFPFTRSSWGLPPSDWSSDGGPTHEEGTQLPCLVGVLLYAATDGSAPSQSSHDSLLQRHLPLAAAVCCQAVAQTAFCAGTRRFGPRADRTGHSGAPPVTLLFLFLFRRRI